MLSYIETLRDSYGNWIIVRDCTKSYDPVALVDIEFVDDSSRSLSKFDSKTLDVFIAKLCHVRNNMARLEKGNKA